MRARATLLLLVLTLALTTACPRSSLEAQKGGEGEPDTQFARPPNVLLIVMDTTRGDRCGFNGYDRPTTPGLDRFAADAVTFTTAWTPAPWTPPAHASLFSGLRPIHHGLMSGTRDYLTPNIDLMAEHLKRAGYATAAFVNNPVVNPTAGLLQGCDTVRLLYAEQNRLYPWAAGTHTEALAWLDGPDVAGADKPFFLFLNHMEPHGPYTPPPAQQQRFLRSQPRPRLLQRARAFYGLETLSANLGISPISDEFAAILSDLYDAEIATLDAEIDNLLSELAQRELLEETLVVITSDHGENLGDHGLVDHMLSIHRTLLHVPLIIRLPGKFDGGKRVPEVVRLEDVLPTVLEVCGLEVPEGLDGTTLSRVAAGRIAVGVLGRPERLLATARKRYAAELVARFDHEHHSVFDGRWHLIRIGVTDQLFDTLADPGETNDLAAERPEVVRRLAELLTR